MAAAGEPTGRASEVWIAYECANEHRFAVEPHNATALRVIKCAVCGTITVKALDGAVVPAAALEVERGWAVIGKGAQCVHSKHEPECASCQRDLLRRERDEARERAAEASRRLEEAEAARNRRITELLRTQARRIVTVLREEGDPSLAGGYCDAADLIEQRFLARVSSEGVSSGADESERNEHG